MAHDGGCFCGALRFTATAGPLDAGFCHCKVCQRSTGAPVLAFASYPVEHFSYTSGAPAIYRSSPRGQREFCSRCGTQIAYRDVHDAATVEVNLGSLDEPGAVLPRYHIWCGSRIAWFDTADSLPRFDESKPGTCERRSDGR